MRPVRWFTLFALLSFLLPPAVARADEPAPAAAPAATAPAAATAPVVAPPKLGGYFQVREVIQKDIGLTSTLNRARFSIDGALPSHWSYRALAEMENATGAKTAAAFNLREAYARWSDRGVSLQFGQFKVPFTREYLISTPLLETGDLATVVDSLAPKYDIGATAEYNWLDKVTVTAGVFNGEGANASANRDSLLMLVGRVVVRPVSQLSLGASATRDGPDSMRVGLEGELSQSGATLRGEWMKRHKDGRAGGRDDNGWYVLAAYRATPTLQPLLRAEDFQRPYGGAAKRIRGLTLGTNVDLAPGRVRLLAEWVRHWQGVKQLAADQWLGQLQVRF